MIDNNNIIIIIIIMICDDITHTKYAVGVVGVHARFGPLLAPLFCENNGRNNDQTKYNNTTTEIKLCLR